MRFRFLAAFVLALFITPALAAPGDLDTSFGGGDGWVSTPISRPDADQARSVIRQADGKLVVVGYSAVSGYNDFALVRYNDDGSLDTTFSGDGKLTTAIGASADQATSVIQQADGKLVAAGYSYDGNSNDFTLVRYNSNGTLDTAFSGDGKLTTNFGFTVTDDQANSVIQQADGKLVVAGYSNNGGSNQDFALARYNSNGGVDYTFNSNGFGTVTTSIGTSDDVVNSVIQQADGKLVAAGYSRDASNKYSFALVRYNSNATLDTTFNGTGKLITAISTSDDFAYSVIQQADGKLVAAGSSNGDFALVRYNSDGTLDTTFNGTGKLNTAIGTNSEQVYSVIQQADGKLAAAGFSYNGSNTDFALVRYNSDGTLDTSFNSTGKLTTAIGTSAEAAYSVIQQADGKLVLAGYSSGSSQDFALVRVDSDGTLDTTFDTDGKLLTNIAEISAAAASSVLQQADGKLVAAGYSIIDGSTYDMALVRYNSDGILDTSFNGTGKLTTAIGTHNDLVSSVIQQADGKLVVAGSSYNNSNYDFALVRYNSNGSLDTTFNGTGKLTTAIGASDDQAYSVIQQADGKLVAAGYSNNSGNYDFALVRYNSNGTLDTSFNGTGKLTTDIDGTSYSFARSVIQQADGKLVVAGYSSGSNYDFVLARYNSDGTLDTAFNGTGTLITAIGASIDTAYSVIQQVDGKLVVAGNSYNGSNYDFALVRYNSNGTLDTTFNGTGMLTTAIGASTDIATSVIQQADGKLVAAGYSRNGSGNDDFALVRYNNDGTLDATFNGTGKRIAALGTSNDIAQSLIQQADGKLAVVGYSSGMPTGQEFVVARFESGQPDMDGDGYIDGLDNCTAVANATQIDTDHDGIGDACDTTPNGDTDNDTVDNAADNCISVSNTDQLNTDGDSEGDACDNDDDNDGVADVSDAFPLDSTESVDTDGDGIGDNSDPTPNGDTDNDGIDNAADNCVSVSNTDQLNTDGDSEGDACDNDDDNDGVADVSDAFPLDATESVDTDGDGIGDNADTTPNGDADNDGVDNLTDNCISVSNADQLNTDGDSEGNACDSDDDNDGVDDITDAFPIDDSESVDTDGDGIGDNADTTPNGDTDNDGIDNLTDNCVSVSNIDQLNTDGDSEGNACDSDDDNDGVADVSDAFPIDDSESVDTDSDGIGDNSDPTPNGDTDSDGIDNAVDNCVSVSNTDQLNTDNDTQGNACDNDDDNDSVADISDAFPLDASESVDTDSDTVGDNTDNCVAVANTNQLDTDTDGAGDVCDTTPNGDTDNDGIDNLTDNCVSVSNTDQLNTDGDAQGNVCDTDDDSDGVADASDAFPLDATESVDTDSDTVGDNADNCVAVANTNQLDTDADGAGDVCDNTPNGDIDNDGIDNAVDNCVSVSNADQLNTDNDAQGDACDSDDDNDSVQDGSDNCPLIANSNQLDYDADNIGDACDEAVPLPEDIAGVMKNAKAGSAVAFAGDVNGDGYGDYVIGMPGYDIPAAPPLKTIQDAGRAEVISGKTGAVLMSVNGVAAKDAMGFAVAGNDDIDNDGFDDVVVGAPNADDFSFGLADVGSTTILFGPNGNRTKTFIGKSRKSLSGSAVALADVNGDNHADIIIGAPKADDVARSLVDAGNVTVISGNGYSVLNTLYVAKAKANAGTSVAASDINNDGNADIIIGAPNDDDAANKLKDAGSVSVYDITGTELLRKYGAVANAHFGKSVASGDVNNDGVDDVLVGAPDDDNGKIKDVGSVTVYSGSDSSPLIKKYGLIAKVNLGNSATAGDVNADGYADIIAGAWKDDSPTTPKITKDTGSVSVWSGNGYALINTVYGDAAHDYFGSAVSAGDINSDGKSDLIIGIPGFGIVMKDTGGVKVLSGAGLGF